MRGRNDTWHRYRSHNHDPLRVGGQDRRCPKRNVRADALDKWRPCQGEYTTSTQ
jgi:site-specific DNA recombinase